MPRDKVEMCFMNPARTLEEALSQAWKRQGRSARMLVMPYGNLTLAVGK